MSSSSGAGGGPIRRRSGGTSSSAADSTSLHGPEHEMHRAIGRSRHMRSSFVHVQRMLDKGETFCRGDGLNCFVLAVRNRTHDLSRSWDMLMEMLQVDSRGVHVRDQDGKTLLNYFYADVDKMKHLIELGADLNNVDNCGKNVIQSVYSSTKFFQHYAALSVWDMLLEHKEIQTQVRGDFFAELLLQMKKICCHASEMLCNLIQKGLMSVEELTVKLQMHPLFFIIQIKNRESLKLLIHIWGDDPDRKENVSAIGADLNIVDNKGKPLIKCLFSPRVLNGYHFENNRLVLELWNLLIKRREIQSQASTKGFIRSMAALAKKSSLVRMIFASIFQQGIWSVEQLTAELHMHPLFLLVDLAKGRPSEFLQLMKSHPSFFKDRTVLVTTRVPKEHERLWQKVKGVLKLPGVLSFDIFGYILFTLNLRYGVKSYEDYCNLDEEEDDNEGGGQQNIADHLPQCLTSLLKLGFVPSQAAGVVHPIHALLYNLYLNSWRVISDQRHGAIQENPRNILLKTMSSLKDFPVPHQLVLDPETGTLMLDVHLLMTSMMCPAVMADPKADFLILSLFGLITALMQLSPLHPLQTFTTFFKYSSCNFQNPDDGKSFLEAFSGLLRFCLKASGRHQFQGVDQKTSECINRFYEAAEEHFQPDVEYEAEKIRLLREASEKAESEVSSLQWLSILQIRKTLFLSRSSNTVTLPSRIRGLVADKRLPKGLEADVLVYKPNSRINF